MHMSARTRSVSAVIRSVSAPPVLRIDVYPAQRPILLPRSSAGWARSSAGPLLRLLDPRVVREAASSSSDASHSKSPGLECACLAADRPRRAALRVRTPGLACCVAGCSPPGGRARSESVLAPCSMLAWPVSIELIDLPLSHLSHGAVKQVAGPVAEPAVRPAVGPLTGGIRSGERRDQRRAALGARPRCGGPARGGR
jgi:hypothetical protein